MAAVKGDPRNLRSYRKRRVAILNRDGWICYLHSFPTRRSSDRKSVV